MTEGFCPRCGTARRATRYCGVCGLDFQTTPEPTPEPVRRSLLQVPLVRTGLGLLVLAVVLYAAMFLTGGTRSTTTAGIISFGSGYDPATLAIVSRKDLFRPGDTVAWSADLREPANAASLRWVVAKLDGTSESGVLDEQVSISNPTFSRVANKANLSLLLEPGNYVMRFLRDTTLLAEGRFTLLNE